MTEISITNPAYAGDGVSVDCTVDHPKLGLIPFTARSDDPEPFGKEVWVALQDMKIAPYDGPPLPNHLHRDLSPAGFNWLLAYTGLEDGWDALLAHFKASDRATYASLKEARNKNIYRLNATLETVAAFRSIIEELKGQGSVPDDLDVSVEAITAGWEAAAGRNEE